VQILAVDQVLGEKDGQKVIVGKTATIEANPQQATLLANARQLGTISQTTPPMQITSRQ
jgi:pilus assembly protein CpaB